MLDLRIKDTKNFMNAMLLTDSFDFWQLCEADITTHARFEIAGRNVSEYYERTEREDIGQWQQYSEYRSICLEIIKGKKTPVAFSFVFRLPDDMMSGLIEESTTTIQARDILGLMFMIHYRDGELSAQTGTNLAVFSMDKSLEEAFNKFVSNFFDQIGVDYEIR